MSVASADRLGRIPSVGMQMRDGGAGIEGRVHQCVVC